MRRAMQGELADLKAISAEEAAQKLHQEMRAFGDKAGGAGADPRARPAVAAAAAGTVAAGAAELERWAKSHSSKQQPE